MTSRAKLAEAVLAALDPVWTLIECRQCHDSRMRQVYPGLDLYQCPLCGYWLGHRRGADCLVEGTGPWEDWPRWRSDEHSSIRYQLPLSFA